MWDFRLANEDCFATFARIPDGKVDLVVCDPPYGVVECAWDSIIPLDRMWSEIRRVLKPLGACVLTATQPFTTKLITSNPDWFKYSWVWIKNKPTDFPNAKNKPMRRHEDVLIFSEGTTANCSPRRMPYYPQGLVPTNSAKVLNGKRTFKKQGGGGCLGERPSHREYVKEFEGYPDTVLVCKCVASPVHPTQKPVELMEYLIRTYSQPGEIVLDFTMGSGTTGVAAGRSGRRFIGCDADTEHGYFKIAKQRIEAAYRRLPEWVDGITE